MAPQALHLPINSPIVLHRLWHLQLAYILGIFVVGPVVNPARILDCIHADVIPGANTDVLLQSVDLY